MSRFRATIFAALALASLGPAAQAQSPLTGVWTWQSPGNAGLDANALALGPDGSYVRASQLANGTLLRSWGQYQVFPVGPNQVRLQTQANGWMPRQICVVVPNTLRNCQPAPPAPPLDLLATFTSPSSLQVDGSTLMRGQDSPLLHMSVGPVNTIVMAPQPSAPMPQLHPYVTPNGPGNVMANQFHESNKAWLDQNMRGCTIDQYGRRWGCQQ